MTKVNNISEVLERSHTSNTRLSEKPFASVIVFPSPQSLSKRNKRDKQMRGGLQTLASRYQGHQRQGKKRIWHHGDKEHISLKYTVVSVQYRKEDNGLGWGHSSEVEYLLNTYKAWCSIPNVGRLKKINKRYLYYIML